MIGPVKEVIRAVAHLVVRKHGLLVWIFTVTYRKNTPTRFGTEYIVNKRGPVLPESVEIIGI
jgi:hypothetical protein